MYTDGTRILTPKNITGQYSVFEVRIWPTYPIHNGHKQYPTLMIFDKI